MFVHTVYFWVKEQTSDEGRAQLINDCTHLLAKIPTVVHLWVGKPATTRRPVVDHSYDVGLTVVLNDLAGHDAYQVHPLHLEFVKRNGPNFGRVQIYDAVD